jgi:hypothetical protein
MAIHERETQRAATISNIIIMVGCAVPSGSMK